MDRRDRFWAKVSVGAHDECWQWSGCKDRDGYGRVKVGKRAELAHRVAFREAVGPIGEGLCVLHSCDNPACVNPAHLSLGNHAENMADMAEKGRADRTSKAFGERSGTARLTESAVRSIRESSAPTKLIAELFAVSRETVRLIRIGRSWKRVA